MVKNTITKTEKIYLLKKYLDDSSFIDFSQKTETEQEVYLDNNLNNILLYCDKDIY